MAVPIVLMVFIYTGFLQVGLFQAVNTANNVGIYGGHDINIEEAPYMAGVYTSEWVSFNNWFFRFQCGGSIIHERFILTAAHCVVGHYSARVSVGSNCLDNSNLKAVLRRYPHENFDRKHDYNDICLLELTAPLQFGLKIAPINLPNEGYELGVGTLVDVTGWGTTETSSDVVNKLRQVTVPIVSRWFCVTNFICAGAKGIGTCDGDSGGPLTYNNTLIGVVSYRTQLECSGKYGTIYAKIARYSQWIKIHISN